MQFRKARSGFPAPSEAARLCGRGARFSANQHVAGIATHSDRSGVTVLGWQNRSFLWMLTPVLAVVLSSCVKAHSTPDSFLVPEERFFDSVRTVVMAPTRVEGIVPIDDQQLAMIDRLLEEKLCGVGYSVVSAEQYAGIWRQIARSTGGFYDQFTGERDDEKYTAATNRLFAELKGRFKPDALFYPEIWEVSVPFSYGEASWAGVVEEVMGGVGYTGEISASTLMLVIEDIAGTEIYVKEAGLELLEYMDDGEFSPMPADLAFNDSTLLAAAVDSVLDPILRAARDANELPTSPAQPPDTSFGLLTRAAAFVSSIPSCGDTRSRGSTTYSRYPR